MMEGTKAQEPALQVGERVSDQAQGTRGYFQPSHFSSFV